MANFKHLRHLGKMFKQYVEVVHLWQLAPHLVNDILTNGCCTGKNPHANSIQLLIDLEDGRHFDLVPS